MTGMALVSGTRVEYRNCERCLKLKRFTVTIYSLTDLSVTRFVPSGALIGESKAGTCEYRRQVCDECVAAKNGATG